MVRGLVWVCERCLRGILAAAAGAAQAGPLPPPLLEPGAAHLYTDRLAQFNSHNRYFCRDEKRCMVRLQEQEEKKYCIKTYNVE